MKNLLEKQILFPKAMGLAPYFWLLWYIPAISLVMTFPLYLRSFLFLILLAFLKIYRDSFFLTSKKFSYNILFQLLLATVFAVITKYPFLYIYTGYVIGGSYYNTAKIKQLIYLYYLSSLLTSGYGIYTILFSNLNDIIYFFFGIAFILGCVPVSYSTMKSRQLKQNNKRLELLIRRSERDRIAQQLHDNLGQSFSILALKAELAQKLIDKNKLSLSKEQLNDIATTARQDLDLVREIVANLKFNTILQTLHHQYYHLKDAGIMLYTNQDELTADWDKVTQNVISQAITEAVTNCIKYSKATRLDINFSDDHENYFVKIADNGIGFQNNNDDKREKFGLAGIKKNITNLNGQVDFKSNNGAIIAIKVPKPERDDKIYD